MSEVLQYTPVSIQERIAGFGRALKADELAELLAVSPVTVFKKAKAGIIPSFRIGTAVRFCPRTVSEWLSRQ